MIAVAACSHSLDALYAELAEHTAPKTLAKWQEARRGGRWREIAAILDLAVDADVEAWRPRLKTLFEGRRNPVVHPKVRWWTEDSGDAPLGDLFEADTAEYTVEAVEESVDLLLEILSACAEAQRRSFRRIGKRWSVKRVLGPMVEHLKQRRAELRRSEAEAPEA